MAEIINWQHLVQGNSVSKRYALTVLAVVSMLALRLILYSELTGRAPYLLFFLVIVMVKSFWGRGPALLATALGGISAWYFLIQPLLSFTVANRTDLFNLVRYFAIGATVSFLGEKSIPSFVIPVATSINAKFRVARQTAVLAGAVVVLAGMGLLLHHDFESAQNAEGWVVDTFQVMNSAESFLSSIKDAETGERGFMLTGDERFLVRYKSVVVTIPTRLKELKDLTSDSRPQQTRWVEINRLTQERLSMLERGIHLRTASGVGAAIAAVRSGQGEEAMDKLRSVLDAFVAEERQLLVERTTKAKDQASRARWVLGLGSLAMIILLVLASVVIERETIQREEIARDLRRHADLLEQAHDSLMTSRLGGVIGYWSRGAETLYGYPREEAVGRVSHELLQTQHPMGIARVDAMLERDGHWTGELTQTTKDGRTLTTDAVWTLALEADGSKTVLEANRDVTERRRAEAENVLLATAIEQAAETVVITDRRGEIQYVNPAFTRTTGYTRAEALGLNPRILKSGCHDSGFYRDIWAALSAGKLWFGEFTNKRRDGTLYTEEATIAPVRDAKGETTNYIAIKSDITERKKSETALRESERMLSFFVQHAPAGIALMDQDMRYLAVSQRWMTDYRLGDRNILGLSHYEVFPEIPEHWKEIHRRCLAGAVESCEEDPFPREDGKLDWVCWEIRPWRKLDESIGGIIMFSELITERKQTVEALKRSEYLLRESQRVGRIGSYELDIASGLWSSSAVLDEIFGIGRDYSRDVNGWLALMPPGPRAELAAYFQEIITESKRFDRDYQIVRLSDGTERWVSGKGELILDGESQPIKMIGTIQDITEQKEADAARKESELRYRQLFERSESALGLYEVVLDGEGNPSDLRFVDVNRVYERLVDLSRSEILGRTLREVKPESEKSAIELFCRVATTGEPATFEGLGPTTGRYVSGIAYSPAPHQVAVSFVDVTERRQAEEKIRLLNIELEERVRARTAELEVANRELETFAHSVSHDLRAPLRSIDGWSLALLEDCSELLDPQGRKYLDRVRSEAQRMGTLIDDILHLSRVSRGELDLKCVDLTGLAETIANRLKEAHADRSIEFVVARNLSSTGDPRLLEIALTNLFGNAVKFTGPRLDARVEFGQTEVEGSPAFFVRDNGVGFEMAYAEMLFAPFQRLHRASEFPGSGIGLATVQRVIHRHGGRIWADARVGKGATFYFTLGADKA